MTYHINVYRLYCMTGKEIFSSLVLFLCLGQYCHPLAEYFPILSDPWSAIIDLLYDFVQIREGGRTMTLTASKASRIQRVGFLETVQTAMLLFGYLLHSRPDKLGFLASSVKLLLTMPLSPGYWILHDYNKH